MKLLLIKTANNGEMMETFMAITEKQNDHIVASIPTGKILDRINTKGNIISPVSTLVAILPPIKYNTTSGMPIFRLYLDARSKLINSETNKIACPMKYKTT